MTTDATREKAISEFTRTWEEYRFPTRAAEVISEKYGMGRTTLVGWLRARGLWPSQRAGRVLELEEENRMLREENARLRKGRT